MKNTCKEKIKASLRAEFLNALDSMELEHKVKVNQKELEGGKIDYNSDDEPLSLKSARLSRKTDKATGMDYYMLKVVVE